MVAPAPLPLFKPAPVSLTGTPVADAAADVAAAVPCTHASASSSHSHSHASSLAAADHHCAAALLRDEASTPTPIPMPPLNKEQRQLELSRELTLALPLLEQDEPLLQQHQQQQQQDGMMKEEAAAAEERNFEEEDVDGRSWLHALVTCPWLFKPCPDCCRSHTGREVLMTYFDPSHPMARGLCSFCPDRAARSTMVPGGLLQIRRSTYHEVVKASDLGRLADVSGIQHYVINGAKVVFLRPRPQPRPPKGVTAPSRCAVDGRQLMDGAARYCSLQCKLHDEDPSYSARHALAAARAQVAAGQLAADLVTVTAAGGPVMAAIDVAGGGAGGPDQHAHSQPPQHAGAKRASGLLRYEGAGDDSGDDEDAADQLMGGSRRQSVSSAPAGDAGTPRWGARGKRQRSAPAGAAAAARGAEAAAAAAPDAHAAPEGHGATPASSHDSGRSSTCRWHSKRRKGEPMRAPLQ